MKINEYLNINQSSDNKLIQIDWDYVKKAVDNHASLVEFLEMAEGYVHVEGSDIESEFTYRLRKSLGL